MPVTTPRKLLASIGADASLPTDVGASAILSPDGTTLAFVGRQAGGTRLFVRKLDQLQAAPLASTEGAGDPFFSPDGQWIAFFAGGKLKKVSVAGGAVVNLSDAPSDRGGTWTDDDTIIFTPTGSNSTHARIGGWRDRDGLRHVQQRREDAAVAACAPQRQRRALYRAFDDGRL